MSDTNQYEPPRVWTWDAESGGKWASINRPVSGSTHEATWPWYGNLVLGPGNP